MSGGAKVTWSPHTCAYNRKRSLFFISLSTKNTNDKYHVIRRIPFYTDGLYCVVFITRIIKGIEKDIDEGGGSVADGGKG